MSLSWPNAFKASVMVCLYYCVWIIIGSVIIFVGVLIAGDALTSGNLGTSFLILAAFYIVGLLIIAFGGFASIIKVTVDTARKR